jgi:hypothetical protein
MSESEILLPAFEKYLPESKLPILSLLAIKLPASAPPAPSLIRPKKFISELPPNSEDIHEITSLLMPPPNILSALQDLIKDPTMIVNSIQCPHEPSAGGKRFPTATVFYWTRVVAIRDVQSSWQHAVNNLQARIVKNNSELLQTAVKSLSYTPWLENVPLNKVVTIQRLSAFLTDEWLDDEHELLMLDLLKKDLEEEGQRNSISVENTAFSLLLKSAKADQENYPIKKHYQWLREKGEALANGENTHLATIVNIEGNHWVAVIIDSQNKVIHFGDSFRHTIPNDLKHVFNWWLGFHMNSTPFSYQPLPVSRQSDTFSCGVLCWDGLRSFLLKSKPRLINPKQALDERIRIFLRLVKPFDNTEVKQSNSKAFF